MDFVREPDASARSGLRPRPRRPGGRGAAGASQVGEGVERAVAEVRARVAGRVTGLAAAWTATAAFGLLLAARVAAGGGGWAAGSPGPLLVVSAMGALVLAAAWLWAALRARWADERVVARAMDGAAGLSAGAVLGGLELSRGSPAGTSAGLRAMALRSVSERLGAGPAALSGVLGDRLRLHARRAHACLAAVAAVVVAVAARAPGRAMDAWGGLLTPIAILAEPVLPPVSARPGTVEAARGSEVEVEVRAPLRDDADLRWAATGQVARLRAMPLLDGIARTRLPPLTSVTRYWVEAPDGARSPEYVLTPVDPLLVASVDATVFHPPHTGLPPSEHRGAVPHLEIVEGSRISLRGSGNRAIGRARLVRGDGSAEVEFDVRGTSFSAEWVPRSGGVFAWEFADAAGALSPPPLRVRMIADSPPRVSIEHPEALAVLPAAMRQPLVVRALDDFGIGRLEIVAWRVSAFGDAGEPVVAVAATEPGPGVVARPALDVSGWRLSPGDTVRYLARATDNHPSAQSAETAEHVLRVPGTLDLERAAGEAMARAADAAQGLAAEAREAEEDARALLERGERRGPAGEPGAEQRQFADREEMVRAVERRDQLAASVDSLRRELAALRAALERSGLSSAEARGRLGEMASALDDVAEAADPKGAPLADAAGMDSSELMDALRRAAREQEEIRSRLEESLAGFERAAVDQGLDVAVQEAEALAERQASLAAEMAGPADAGDQTSAERQDALAERTAGLEAQVQELMERLAGMGETKAQAGLEAAATRLSEGGARMNEAAQAARRRDSRSAERQAAQAAGNLSEAARAVDEAGAQMRERRMAALRAALSRTAVDALALSRRQAEVQEQMRGAAAADVANLRGAEAAIAQGIRNLAENYAIGTGMGAPGARDVMTSAGRALEHVDRTVEAMGARRSSASPYESAREVVRALNETARLAMEAAEQDPSAGASSAGEAMMQQLAELAQQQGDIIQDAAGLAPMQQGSETSNEAMREIAGEQEEVAGELGTLAGRDETRGEEGPLGDLGGMAAEARRLAEALAQGRFDPDVLRRQERLFHRLLDAGRGLERDEESHERESETPGEFLHEDVAPVAASAMDAIRYRLPDPVAMRSLPPAMQALVVRYFQRLNERAPPAPRGARDEDPRP